MINERYWWEKNPLRYFEFCNCMNPWVNPFNRNPVKEAELKAKVFANMELLHVWGAAQPPEKGFDDTGFYFKTKVASRENIDYLAKYLPEAHKRGIKVIVYLNVHWYNSKFAEKHPDWVQVTEKGKPLDELYGSKSTSFCVNNPSYREWCFQILRDLCAYDVDGIFYDGPVFFEETCYCKFCLEKFRSQYGKEMPPKSQRQHFDFRYLLEFQAKSLGEFLRDSRNIIKSINSEIIFYANSQPLAPSWANGRLNRELIKHQDILGAEGGFIYGDLTRTPIWKPGSTAKLLATQSDGKPVAVFDSAAHYPWALGYMLPPTEIWILWAESVANGANAFLVMFGIDPKLVPGHVKAIGQMHKFVRDNAQYYMGTKSEAQVALVWSEKTANFYEGSYVPKSDFTREYLGREIGNVFTEFHGFYEMLLRNHIPFDVIDDVYLEKDNLQRYRLIILPNMACMSPETAQRLKDYVWKGGNLICTFETSLYDDYGERQQGFQLQEVYGAESKNKVFGPMNHDYLTPAATHQILNGISKWIPAPKYSVEIKLREAIPLMFYSQRQIGRYDAVPSPSPDVALAINTYGMGKTVYFSGTLADSYVAFHFNDYLRLTGNIIRELAPPPISVENIPASTEVTLRSQAEGAKMIIHLVNFTGEMTRPMRRIIPIKNAKITLKVTRRVQSVRALRSKRDLKFRSEKSAVAFTVPRVEEYEAIVVSLGD